MLVTTFIIYLLQDGWVDFFASFVLVREGNFSKKIWIRHSKKSGQFIVHTKFVSKQFVSQQFVKAG